MKQVTIEDIYEMAHNELANEFGLNGIGENAEPIELDFEWRNVVYNAKIDDETVDTVIEAYIDNLIDMGLLYTKKAKHGIIEVHKR